MKKHETPCKAVFSSLAARRAHWSAADSTSKSAIHSPVDPGSKGKLGTRFWFSFTGGLRIPGVGRSRTQDRNGNGTWVRTSWPIKKPVPGVSRLLNFLNPLGVLGKWTKPVSLFTVPTGESQHATLWTTSTRSLGVNIMTMCPPSRVLHTLLAARSLDELSE